MKVNTMHKYITYQEYQPLVDIAIINRGGLIDLILARGSIKFKQRAIRNA